MITLNDTEAMCLAAVDSLQIRSQMDMAEPGKPFDHINKQNPNKNTFKVVVTGN